jgi:hypothetical protein
MSAAGISSSSVNQYQLSAPNSPYQQAYQQLGQDLKSGNLTAAQSDFSTLQKAFSQPATTSATTSAPASPAFNQLATDLKSGNLSAAKQDFSTLQQSLVSHGGPQTNHFHNHYRLNSSVGSSSTTGPSTLLQDLSQLGQSLQSGNLASAQQAYAALQAQPPVPGGGGSHQTEPPVYGPPTSIGGLINPEPPTFGPPLPLVA